MSTSISQWTSISHLTSQMLPWQYKTRVISSSMLNHSSGTFVSINSHNRTIYLSQHVINHVINTVPVSMGTVCLTMQAQRIYFLMFLSKIFRDYVEASWFLLGSSSSPNYLFETYRYTDIFLIHSLSLDYLVQFGSLSRTEGLASCVFLASIGKLGVPVVIILVDPSTHLQ